MPRSASAAFVLAAALGASLVGAAGCQPFAPGDPVWVPSSVDPPVDHGVVASEALGEAVDAAALEFLDTHRLPGLAVGLVRDGQVQMSAAYGWSQLGELEPMTVDTPILLSSVSKTFIGVTAMMAVEDGVLELDDPLGAHLDFAVDNPKLDGETITVRDALTHNTGLRDTSEYGDSYVVGDPSVDLARFGEGYVTKKGEFWRSRNFSRSWPGTRFRYSNVGASLGALAIAEAEALEFMDLVRTRVLEPLDMDDSAYLLADLPREPAVPYGGTTKAGRFEPWPQYGYPTYPDGMLRSSADDMARYLAMIGGGGRLDGVELLPTARVDEMLTVDAGAGTDEDGQCVAWAMREVDGRELFGHNGGDFGSTTELWLDREAGVGVVVLLAADVPDFRALVELEMELLDLVESTP